MQAAAAQLRGEEKRVFLVFGFFCIFFFLCNKKAKHTRGERTEQPTTAQTHPRVERKRQLGAAAERRSDALLSRRLVGAGGCTLRGPVGLATDADRGEATALGGA